MTHLIRLAKQHDTFYCPLNRVHLYFYNPSGSVHMISKEIERALKNKKIVDVNGTIAAEIKAKEEEIANAAIIVTDADNDVADTAELLTGVVSDVLQEQSISFEEVTEKNAEEAVQEPEESVEDVKPEPEEQGVELDSLSKDELISFIKENEMTMKELGVTGKSSEEKIREAIAAHLTKAVAEDEEAN